jgi:sugar phosphate isomerase/epimerase
MQLAVFTVCTPEWSPVEAASAIAGLGFTGVVWRVADQDDAAEPGFWAGNRATWPLAGLEDRIDEIAKVSSEAGLSLPMLGGYAFHDEPDDVELLLRAAARLGTPAVRVRLRQLGEGDSARDELSRARADFVRIAAFAAAAGVRALVQLHPRTVAASASGALRLLDGIDPGQVGVIHDLGNAAIEGREGIEGMRSGLQLLGPYLAQVIISAAAWHATTRDADGTQLWDYGWTELRDSQADLRAYLRQLQEIGYDGWLTLQDFSTRRPLAERLADDIAYLRSCALSTGISL